MASGEFESKCRRCGSFVSLEITKSRGSYQHSFYATTVAFVHCTSGSHSHQKQLLEGPWSGCRDSGPPSRLKSVPCYLNSQWPHGVAHPQGACIHSQHTLVLCGALSQLCSRYPLKSHLPPTCQPQKRIPASAVLILNQTRGLES